MLDDLMVGGGRSVRIAIEAIARSKDIVWVNRLLKAAKRQQPDLYIAKFGNDRKEREMKYEGPLQWFPSCSRDDAFQRRDGARCCLLCERT